MIFKKKPQISRAEKKVFEDWRPKKPKKTLDLNAKFYITGMTMAESRCYFTNALIILLDKENIL